MVLYGRSFFIMVEKILKYYILVCAKIHRLTCKWDLHQISVVHKLTCIYMTIIRELWCTFISDVLTDREGAAHWSIFWPHTLLFSEPPRSRIQTWGDYDRNWREAPKILFFFSFQKVAKWLKLGRN